MSRSCVKCNVDVAIILVGTNGSFCKQCFEKYFTHKFRASLGKNPVVRHGQRVAVAFSGGNNSSALLKLLLQSLSPNAFKRLKFYPGIIFVDETSVLPVEDYSSKIAEINAIMADTGLPYDTVKVEEVLNLHQFEDGIFSSESLSERMKSLFDSIASNTSKEELLYRMRCKLLAYKAKELGYQHVFLGETSSRLAVNILSNIAQGRGAHLPLDTGFTDDGRYEGINMLRPLRDMTSKEITVYNAIHKVSTVFFPSFSTKLPANSSIQRLTEDFIVSLSANFPSTETTVFRTSNKLKMDNAKGSNSKADDAKLSHSKCFLCCGPLDTYLHKHQAMALGAMQFTQSLCDGELGIPDSSHVPNSLISMQPGGKDSVCNTEDYVTEEPFGQLSSNLCHACRTLKTDFDKSDKGTSNRETFLQLLTHKKIPSVPNELKEKIKNPD